MAGLASSVFALILLLHSPNASAGDLFTGFQMDGRAQYFAYLGVRQDFPWESFGLKGYAQLFAAGQGYEYQSDDRDIDADVQFLIPSLGASMSLGDGAWSVATHVGPKLRWKNEVGFENATGRDFDVGVFVQAESMYWQETHSLHGIVSYGSLDNFFFGRIRGKLRAYSPETGCCSIFAGMEVAGMGNDDYRAVQAGPVLEVPIASFFLLVRGGYQHDDSFGSGGYGGLEVYTAF
jgi:hypothetical protein